MRGLQTVTIASDWTFRKEISDWIEIKALSVLLEDGWEIENGQVTAEALECSLTRSDPRPQRGYAMSVVSFARFHLLWERRVDGDAAVTLWPCHLTPGVGMVQMPLTAHPQVGFPTGTCAVNEAADHFLTEEGDQVGGNAASQQRGGRGL